MWMVILPNECVGMIAWIKRCSVFDRISILFHPKFNFLRTLTRRSPWACRQCCSESRRCTASRETEVRSWSCDNSPPSRLQWPSYLRHKRIGRGALYAGEDCDWWTGCLGHVSQFASSHSMYLCRPVQRNPVKMDLSVFIARMIRLLSTHLRFIN